MVWGGTAASASWMPGLNRGANSKDHTQNFAGCRGANTSERHSRGAMDERSQFMSEAWAPTIASLCECVTAVLVVEPNWSRIDSKSAIVRETSETPSLA
jgi:hypothetical protein